MSKITTDPKQSRILTEILPKETADAAIATNTHEVLPAWSLSKLLDMLPNEVVIDDEDEWKLEFGKETETSYYLHYRDVYEDEIVDSFEFVEEELIDCCMEAIVKLNQLNLL